VIDLIAGVLFAWLTLEAGTLLDDWWTRWKKRTVHKHA
jgi:hypothetical protein